MNTSKKSTLREWIETIVIAVALALVVRATLVQAFKIPSGSMMPTLEVRDRLLVNKILYRFNEPQRGDIVVFKYPKDPKVAYIKRLIAKGGELVQIKNHDIYINGKLVTDPVIKDIYYYNGGILIIEDTSILVPEDHYFVLGDNSMNSRDSRYWGFVPKKNVIGKAFVVYWPITRVTVLK